MNKIAVALLAMYPFAGGACMVPGACGLGGHIGHGAGSHESQAQEAKAPEDERPAPDPDFDAARTLRVLEAYDRIVVALADDELGGVGEATSRIAANAPNDAIRDAAETMAVAETERKLSESREHFKALSDAVARYVAANYESLEAGLEKDKHRVPRKAYCPMAEAVWLQYGEEITNPYYGASMLRCGEFQNWPEPMKGEATGHRH
jgi:Cu(I)/Ag(I) efflux system membrane fusion protein